MKFRVGIITVAIMATSPVSAQVDQDVFNSLVSESQSQTGEEESSKEVEVESIEIPRVFKDMDNQQARINQLQKMITIAELESKYSDLTGLSADDSQSPVNGADDDQVKELHREINGLKQKFAAIAAQEQDVRGSNLGGNAERKNNLFRESETWRVKGISIYGDEKTAVIDNIMGADFVIRQGDKVGDVRILSIGPGAVKAKEAGKVIELPLAGSGYTEQNSLREPVSYPSERMSGGAYSDEHRTTVSYPGVADSTSR